MLNFHDCLQFSFLLKACSSQYLSKIHILQLIFFFRSPLSSCIFVICFLKKLYCLSFIFSYALDFADYILMVSFNMFFCLLHFQLIGSYIWRSDEIQVQFILAGSLIDGIFVLQSFSITNSAAVNSFVHLSFYTFVGMVFR